MNNYWKSIEEKSNPPKEAVSHVKRNKGNGDSLGELLDTNTLNAPSSRRDFLKLFGFSIASAAVLSSCEQPVRKAIPYLIQPSEITPGIANYYASSFFDGQDYCSILVKVRDGRPIKIEGNELSTITKGGTSARVQASVLSLYDEARYREPAINGQKVSWEEFDKSVAIELNALIAQGKEIIILSSSVISPSSLAVIQQFITKYPSVKHVQYDTVSASGILEANEICFGTAVIPSYHFENTSLIVSFAADFLGTWLSPIEYTKQYVQTRSLTEGQKRIGKHIQFESGVSLTGSNSDLRIQMKPSQEKVILANIYNAIAKNLGYSTFSSPPSPVNIDEVAAELLANRGKSLVVSGSNDVSVQIIVNAINFALGNYTGSIDLGNPLQNRKGIDKQMTDAVAAMGEGMVGGIIYMGTNPVFDYPEADKLIENLKKVSFQLSISCSKNETAEQAKYLCPDHHYLESWSDAEIKPGKYSLGQPAIRPLFNTRQAEESLLVWSGDTIKYDEFIKSYWQKNLLPLSGLIDSFNFWNKCLQDGVFELTDKTNSIPHSIDNSIVGKAFSTYPKESELEISLYEKVAMGSGRHANNPWLQEVPDPITRATWDNYLCISPREAKEKGLVDGDLVTLNKTVQLPVLIQPGQAYGTISVAIGYGRKQAGIAAEGVGQNVFGFSQTSEGTRLNYSAISSFEKTGTGYALALTQQHHSMEGRAIIRESSVEEYLKDEAAGNEMHAEYEKHNQTLYKPHEYPGHHWGMVIDLNKCVGCSACLVACTAENNVPVVGKKEVTRAHEMHWIRIDRYYKGHEDNPQVLRQPVMCQHCDNAPCENVCPVGATNHSDEGINQMAYNRCIGTRYCNNNCPYKVRRFNWFDYNMADSLPANTYDPMGLTLDLPRMVLNPDVTVRAKGVIEKCSLCVQRIQAGKLTAKLENRILLDGEIRTACQQACPADAIVFGDANDPNSKVSKLFKDPRNYNLLEELHTLPSVGYLTKISNREQEV